MATMIPDGIDEFKTEGERQFYRFLEAVAKPDQKYTTWYLPDIEGREPDFILFCEDIGLVIFEVKDWALDQIEEANPRSFLLKMGRERRSLKSPLQQAREYFESLMGRIRADGRLLSKEPQYYGKPKVPVDYGVVFPNISRDPYCQTGLPQVISPRRIFFWDDIHAASAICTDSSGECFRRALREMFPPRFRFKITPSEYGHLKQLLFPVVRIEAPQREACIYIDPAQRLNVLDDRQEAIARRTAPGRQILLGPSGSGKTLILAHRAAFLKRYHPEKRILFVCSGVTLANYLKRLLAEKGVGLGPEGVEVCHFQELCSRITGEAVQKEDAPPLTRVLERLEGADLRYEAVLVDAGQDLTEEMFQVIEALLGGDGRSLTIAVDVEQNVYGRPLSWMSRAIADGARVDSLSVMYRSTAEIRQFTSRFTGKAEPLQEADATYCETHGPKPELKRIGSSEAVFALIADTIRMLHDQGEYPLSEMAVLYAEHALKDGERPVPERLIQALDSRGVLSNWFAEDYRSKRSYDITTDRVALAPIQDAGGLDYACVFLVGMDRLPWDAPAERALKPLVVQGITRSRHRLIVPYVKNTALIDRLAACLVGEARDSTPRE